MHIGEQLVVYGTSVISLYTPWFARLADNARFTYEILTSQGTPTFAVAVYHKKSEDTGPGEDLSVSWGTSGDFHLATGSGLKEMIRYKITLTGGTEDQVESVVYRILEPTWFNQAQGTA